MRAKKEMKNVICIVTSVSLLLRILQEVLTSEAIYPLPFEIVSDSLLTMQNNRSISLKLIVMNDFRSLQHCLVIIGLASKYL